MAKTSASHDFKIERLPRNRWQSLFDILKNRLGTIINMGLILFVFSLPLLATMIYANISVYGINEAVIAGSISENDAANAIFHITNSTNAIAIIAMIVLAIGLSGIAKLIRNLIWQEGVFFWADFKSGVKSNFLSFAFTSIILGLANLGLQAVIRYGYFSDGDAGLNLATIIAIVVFVYLLPIIFFVMFQSVLYNLPIGGKFRNAFLLTIKTAPKTFGLILALGLPWLLLLVENETFYVVSIFLLFIVIAPIEYLILGEYCLGVFDRFINQEHHPDIYRKGIWQKCRG